MFVTCHDNMHSDCVSTTRAVSMHIAWMYACKGREYRGPAVVSWACVAQRRDVEWGRKCASHEGMCLCWLQPPITSQRENRHQRRSVSSHSPVRACSFEPSRLYLFSPPASAAPLQSHQVRQAQDHTLQFYTIAKIVHVHKEYYESSLSSQSVKIEQMPNTFSFCLQFSSLDFKKK